MDGMRGTLAAAVLAAAAAGCGRGSPAEGRWERIGHPAEWMELRADGTFLARSYLGPDTVRGTFTVDGDTMRLRSTYGHSGTLVLQDSILVMGDGTRYRRLH